MNIEKILIKHNSGSKLNKLLNKIKNRYINHNLQFNNKISITFNELYLLINEVLNNNSFITCDYCKCFIDNDNIHTIDNLNLCDNCFHENYFICESCGDFIYKEDINILNDESIYCKNCYFIEKQKIYDNYILKNKLLIDLKNKLHPITYNKIKDIQFKIDNNYYTIEKYTNTAYRLGSWTANYWIDIGNNIQSILNAIEINLGCNINKLESITKEYI